MCRRRWQYNEFRFDAIIAPMTVEPSKAVVLKLASLFARYGVGVRNAKSAEEALRQLMTAPDRFADRLIAVDAQRMEGEVLLVEDSATSALFCCRLLSRLGLTTDHCCSAEDAIERLEKKSYDLILVDYMLAGKETGLAVIRAVRAADGPRAAIPILAISSIEDAASRVEILRSGANDFVAKPVVAEELEVRVSNLLVMRRLVRQLELQNEAMRELAMRDQLTSLFNRHYLDRHLPAVIREAVEHRSPLSLILIDLDHFKQINDAYGHRTGDLVLEEVAALLQDRAGEGEIVARIGGEELLVVLPGLGAEAAAEKAESLRREVEELRPTGVPLTASFGVGTLQEGESYEQLFRRVDKAVYRAKSGGRNRVEAA